MRPQHFFRPRILLVESANPGLRGLLLHWGYRVEEATDGAVGLRKAMAWRPEVAIIATDVPPSGGSSVARGLRAIFGPAMLLIGRTRPHQPTRADAASGAGFDCLLSEDADPDELRAVLRRTVGLGAGISEKVGSSS